MKAFRLPGGRKPRSFGEKFDPEGEFFGSRERKPVGDRRPWKRALLCMLGGAVLTGGILLGSGLWRVKEVSAADGQFYTAAVIKEYAAISEGDGMLGFDSSDVAARLRKGLPLLTDIRIRKGLGGKVTITFREINRVYYTCHNENYYLINADFRRNGISSLFSVTCEHYSSDTQLPELPDLFPVFQLFLPFFCCLLYFLYNKNTL